jgi:hypothetical protein
MSMERFGLDYNVLVTASGVGIRIGDVDSIGFFTKATGANSFVTLTLSTGANLAAAATFGYTAPAGWAPIVHFYEDTSNGVGTAVWSNKVANNAAGLVYAGTGGGTGSNVVPYNGATFALGAGVAIAFFLLASQVPAGYNYVIATGTACTVMAISTPDVERAPYLLPAMSS